MADEKKSAPALNGAQIESLATLGEKLLAERFPPSHKEWLELCRLAKHAQPK